MSKWIWPMSKWIWAMFGDANYAKTPMKSVFIGVTFCTAILLQLVA